MAGASRVTAPFRAYRSLPSDIVLHKWRYLALSVYHCSANVALSWRPSYRRPSALYKALATYILSLLNGVNSKGEFLISACASKSLPYSYEAYHLVFQELWGVVKWV